MRPRSLWASARTGTLVLVGAFGLLGIGCAAPDSGETGETILRGGWLFDEVSDTLKPNTGILVRDGRFKLRLQDLQRDLALVLQVLGQVDARHAPFT